MQQRELTGQTGDLHEKREQLFEAFADHSISITVGGKELSSEFTASLERDIAALVERDRRREIFDGRLRELRTLEAAGGSFVGFLPAPTHPLGSRAERRAAKKAGRK